MTNRSYLAENRIKYTYFLVLKLFIVNLLKSLMHPLLYGLYTLLGLNNYISCNLLLSHHC